MKKRIVINTVVKAIGGQIFCDLNGEAAILDVKSGTYYGLNTVGTRIWELIQEPKTVKEVYDSLLNEYDVEPDRCERALLALLQELAANKLISITNEKAAQIS